MPKQVLTERSYIYHSKFVKNKYNIISVEENFQIHLKENINKTTPQNYRRNETTNSLQ